MTIKDYVTAAIQRLDETEVRDVADYLAFLRFRARMHAVPRPDDPTLAAVCSEFAEEDRDLADEGMVDYEQGLRMEDAQ